MMAAMIISYIGAALVSIGPKVEAVNAAYPCPHLQACLAKHSTQWAPIVTRSQAPLYIND